MINIDDKYENPIDIYIYNLAEYTSNFHHKLGLTPNALTTISLILGLLSSYYLYKRQYNISLVLYATAYFYDCLDGYSARKYNMMSKFGDLYDHGSDFVKHLILFYVAYKVNKKLLIKIAPFLLFFFILVSINLSYQKIIYDKKDSSTFISLIKNKDKEHAKQMIKYTKYFGPGTGALFICINIIIFKYYDK